MYDSVDTCVLRVGPLGEEEPVCTEPRVLHRYLTGLFTAPRAPLSVADVTGG